jgi:hypothetical protein
MGFASKIIKRYQEFINYKIDYNNILTIMNMNFLPQELESMITDYKNQMEHKEKYQKCMIELKNLNRDAIYQYNKYKFNNMNIFKPINSINGVLFVHNRIENKLIITEYTTRITIRPRNYY